MTEAAIDNAKCSWAANDKLIIDRQCSWIVRDTAHAESAMRGSGCRIAHFPVGDLGAREHAQRRDTYMLCGRSSNAAEGVSPELDDLQNLAAPCGTGEAGSLTPSAAVPTVRQLKRSTNAWKAPWNRPRPLRFRPSNTVATTGFRSTCRTY